MNGKGESVCRFLRDVRRRRWEVVTEKLLARKPNRWQQRLVEIGDLAVLRARNHASLLGALVARLLCVRPDGVEADIVGVDQGRYGEPGLRALSQLAA